MFARIVRAGRSIRHFGTSYPRSERPLAHYRGRNSFACCELDRPRGSACTTLTFAHPWDVNLLWGAQRRETRDVQGPVGAGPPETGRGRRGGLRRRTRLAAIPRAGRTVPDVAHHKSGRHDPQRSPAHDREDLARDVEPTPVGRGLLHDGLRGAAPDLGFPRRPPG